MTKPQSGHPVRESQHGRRPCAAYTFPLGVKWSSQTPAYDQLSAAPKKTMSQPFRPMLHLHPGGDPLARVRLLNPRGFQRARVKFMCVSNFSKSFIIPDQR